jgi:hypothetical protein
MGGMKMKTTLLKWVVMVAILSCIILTISNEVTAQTHEEKQFEQFIDENNFIPADIAIQQFEKEQHMKVNLPRLLPFHATHRLGHIDEEGRLKLQYMKPGKINEYPSIDFGLYVMSTLELDTHIQPTDDVMTLKSGEPAYYSNHLPDFHTLAFKKNDVGYVFGASPEKVDRSELILMANSIRFIHNDK